MKNEYTTRVIEIISEQLGVSQRGIDEDTLFSDLGADSIDLFQILSALETEYDLEIDPQRAEEMTTVGDAVEYIKNAME